MAGGAAAGPYAPPSPLFADDLGAVDTHRFVRRLFCVSVDKNVLSSDEPDGQHFFLVGRHKKTAECRRREEVNGKRYNS